jgi:hypothetical protein
MRTTSGLALFRRQETRSSHRFAVGRRTRVLAGAVLVVASLALLFAGEAPGDEIRDDLTSAASVAGTLPFRTEPAAVAQALQPSFFGRTVTVDAEAFPAVIYVTVRALEKDSCAAAFASARRIEGRTVIELERFRSAADCRDSNDMTWRIMP